MINAKETLLRMLFLDSLLSLGGIAAATLLFLVALDQQRTVTDKLYQHPFLVTNAAQDLKMEVLTLRNQILKVGLQGQTTQKTRQDMDALRLRIGEDLQLIRSNYIGDTAQVQVIQELVTAWEAEQELALADLEAGHLNSLYDRLNSTTQQLVEELLTRCDAIIGITRSRAAEFALDSQSTYHRNRLMVLLAALVIASLYLLLVTRRNRAKHALFDQLHTLAVKDDLTGALNRRAFLALAETEVQKAQRLGHDLALISIDLDHFKQINDQHGHAGGDAVLRAFSAGCMEVLRQIDALGRLGGEEFAVLLPGASLLDAGTIAERLRTRIITLNATHQGRTIPFTLSAGIAVLDGERTTLDRLLIDADQALYTAKHQGRNTVVLSARGDSPFPGS